MVSDDRERPGDRNRISDSHRLVGQNSFFILVFSRFFLSQEGRIRACSSVLRLSAVFGQSSSCSTLSRSVAVSCCGNWGSGFQAQVSSLIYHLTLQCISFIPYWVIGHGRLAVSVYFVVLHKYTTGSLRSIHTQVMRKGWPSDIIVQVSNNCVAEHVNIMPQCKGWRSHCR